METLFETFIIPLLQKYPSFGMTVIILGGLRMLFKPIMSAWEYVVKQTPDKKDDEVYNTVSQSKFLAFIKWLLDYTASIKVDVIKKK